VRLFRFPCALLLTGALFGAATAPPAVTVSPATAQIRSGATVTFAVTTVGLASPTIDWKIVSTSASPKGNLGSISQSGVYTAPPAPPTPNTVSIQAVDHANATIYGSATVTLLNVAPVLTSVTPSSINTGLAYSVTLTGTGFLPGSQVMFSGKPAAGAKYVSGTEIDLTGSSSLAGGTNISVTVVNPDPGGATSGARNLAVQAAVAVAVTPDKQTIHIGQTETFSAHVLNNANTAVTWQVNGKTGGDSTIGTIDAKGVYTPPSVLPPSAPTAAAGTDPSVTITAVSQADPTKSGSVTLFLENAPPVLTSLTPSAINTGLAYAVKLTGTGFLAGSQVMFNGKPATGATFVSSTEIDLTGTSTLAGGTNISVTVVNPQSGGTSSGARNLAVEAPVAVTVTPDKQTIRIGQTEGFYSHVSNNSNTAVTWQVNGKAGGDSTAGTIDAKGIYTPPAILPRLAAGATPGTAPTVTITAVSQADPTKSASVTLNLENATPAITSVSPAALSTGPVTLTVNGTGFAPGATIWFAGAAVTTTAVSDKQLTASLTVALPAGGIAAVKVVNPNPGTETSNVVAVSVSVAKPKMDYASAERFLEMASFGPTPASIQHLQEIGRDAWLAEQFAAAPSSWPDPLTPNEGVSRLQDAFFTVGLMGNDQLRQRVALALAEILVVSANKDTQFDQMVGYLRLLGNDAFGSYRTLLGDMTLNPAMGIYLDMVNNAKANPAKGTVANENYARESMQLFSLGLVQLNSDGTPVAGNLPEYDQATVTDMAKVFTGWTFAPEPGFVGTWPNPEYDFAPMVAYETYHDNTTKTLNLPISCTIPAGGTALSDLNAALDCLFKQKNVAPFISYRLIQRLVKSAPSPAYVGRVAAVFTSTKGDLKSVVTAILTDDEASAEGTGKLREPILQTTTLLRHLNAKVLNGAATGVAGQSSAMGQTALMPASVFSYFTPSFRVSGFTPPPVAPEFQSQNAVTEFGRVNFAYRAVTNGISSNVQVDFSNWMDLSAIPAKLAEAVNQALWRGEMSSDEKNAVIAAIGLSTNPLTKVRDAVYVAAAAPQYQVQK